MPGTQGGVSPGVCNRFRGKWINKFKVKRESTRPINKMLMSCRGQAVGVLKER